MNSKNPQLRLMHSRAGNADLMVIQDFLKKHKQQLEQLESLIAQKHYLHEEQQELENPLPHESFLEPDHPLNINRGPMSTIQTDRIYICKKDDDQIATEIHTTKFHEITPPIPIAQEDRLNFTRDGPLIGKMSRDQSYIDSIFPNFKLKEPSWGVVKSSASNLKLVLHVAGEDQLEKPTKGSPKQEPSESQKGPRLGEIKNATPCQGESGRFLVQEALFTKRQLQVIELLKRGYCNKKIASTLHVEYSTVKAHLRNIFIILKVSGRQEALVKLLNP